MCNAHGRETLSYSPEFCNSCDDAIELLRFIANACRHAGTKGDRMRRTAARRQKLAQGIYIRAGRITAIASVGSGATRQIDEQPFYQDGRALEDVVREATAWRLKRKAEMIEHGPRAASSNTFAGDVPGYLRTIPVGDPRNSPRKQAQSLLAHWIAATLPLSPRGIARGTFGNASRTTITRQDIRVQLTIWQSAGVSPGSLNHRLRVLRGFFRHFATNEDAPLPTDHIKKYPEPEPEVRDIPQAFVEQILAAVSDRGRTVKGQPLAAVSHTKIRLRVMAWTGLPHMGVERLRERDVDFRGHRLYVQPRRKGKGAPGVWLNLLPPAVDALRDYARERLWGQAFCRSSMRIAWRRALARVERQATADADTATLEWLRALPPQCHPYDLRHAYASEAYRVSKDPLAVQELLQHSNLRTTARYAKGAVPERAAAATAAMARRWPAATPRVVHVAS